MGIFISQLWWWQLTSKDNLYLYLSLGLAYLLFVDRSAGNLGFPRMSDNLTNTAQVKSMLLLASLNNQTRRIRFPACRKRLNRNVGTKRPCWVLAHTLAPSRHLHLQYKQLIHGLARSRVHCKSKTGKYSICYAICSFHDIHAAYHQTRKPVHTFPFVLRLLGFLL